MKLAVLFTGGKDSIYSIYLAKKQGHQLTCLITLKSKNPDSYMFHTPAIELTKLQAEAMELPLIAETTKGEKEKELKDLEKAIIKARKKYNFEGLLTGALFSQYQKTRIEKIARKLRLKTLSPLWHKAQEEEMQELLDNHFKFILTSVAAEGLDKTWLNKIITKKELERLERLNKKIGLNIAGEGGEYESLVIDCPLFQKRLLIKQAQILEENKNTARLIIKKAGLGEK